MSADFAPSSETPETGPGHTPQGGFLGHSGDDWDFSEISELTERQLRSIELTMQGHSDSQIAQRLQINRKTLWRWKTLDPDYRRILANARIQLYAAATDRYQVLLARATSILAKFLEDPGDQRSFPAALAILNMAGCFKPLPPRYFPPDPPPALPEPPPNDPGPDLEPKVG
jgi:hypothetical protein